MKVIFSDTNRKCSGKQRFFKNLRKKWKLKKLYPGNPERHPKQNSEHRCGCW